MLVNIGQIENEIFLNSVKILGFKNAVKSKRAYV